jgi:type III pantothenate kinase
MRRLLLIGNSRWHWGDWVDGRLIEQRHTTAEAGAALLISRPADHWAAVGVVPQVLDAYSSRRLSTAQVPLAQLPPRVGVDRALAAWMAWRVSGLPVLVADAGTALSLTLVDGGGCFRGGRLMAGARLQLQALHQGTASLPLPSLDIENSEAWPRLTDQALSCGVIEGLTAAVVRGFEHRPQPEQDWQLWLTGGDAPLLLRGLQQTGLRPRHADALALEGLGCLVETLRS